jgi:hypothetical protein
LPNRMYAMAAFLAGREGSSVPQFAYSAMVAMIANQGRLPADTVARMLSVEGFSMLSPGSPAEPSDGSAEGSTDDDISALLAATP